MDGIIIRFPIVGQNIFKKLDNKSLANCKLVSKIWQQFLRNDILIYKRKIQKYTTKQIEFRYEWKLVTKKVSSDALKKLATAVEKFFLSNPHYRQIRYKKM